MEEREEETQKTVVKKISTHNMTVCVCGKILWQCKCVGPKEVIIRDAPCAHKGLD